MNLITCTARTPAELLKRINDHEKRGARIKDFGKNPPKFEGEGPQYWATMYPKELANGTSETVKVQ